MTQLVARHERRLRATFQRVLVLSLVTPGTLEACTSKESVPPGESNGDAQSTDVSPLDVPGVDTSSADAADAEALADGGDEAPQDAYVFPVCADASRGMPYFIGDSGKPCYYGVDFSCPLYEPAPGSCYLPAQACLQVCTLPDPLYECLYPLMQCGMGRLLVEAGAPVTIACGICPAVGRRPAGFRGAKKTLSIRDVGAYFERVAELEAASVFAFERLVSELRAHGAPAELLSCARQSRRDEIRHARMTGDLARRFGGKPRRLRSPRRPVRPLARVARENAVEGCVRETFGALIASWQAAHATDPRVRRCMQRIARDETRHAALAWAVAEWAETRLSGATRVPLAKARRTAILRLKEELSFEPGPELVRIAGLPTPIEACALMRATQAS